MSCPQRHVRYPDAAHRNRRRPEPPAAPDRPLDLLRRPDREEGVLAAADADLDRAGCAERQRAVLVADVGPGEDLAPADQVPLAVEREAVVEEPLGFEVAAALGP